MYRAQCYAVVSSWTWLPEEISLPRHLSPESKPRISEILLNSVNVMLLKITGLHVSARVLRVISMLREAAGIQIPV